MLACPEVRSETLCISTEDRLALAAIFPPKTKPTSTEAQKNYEGLPLSISAVPFILRAVQTDENLARKHGNQLSLRRIPQ